MKKFFVIIVLFALPIVAYLFFASGVNNFAKLPVLEENIGDLEDFRTLEGEKLVFQEKITLLGFYGNEPSQYVGNAFNLAEKIYNTYYEFNDFQLVVVAPEEAAEELRKVKMEIGEVADLSSWKFVVGEPKEIKSLFSSLNTNMKLHDDLSTPHVFIIDKNENLRGRSDDGEEGKLYGYDTGSVAELNNKMEDDVKVILAEYRLALKKYNK
ncbi:hypothetical protein [Salinimicrobium sp. GXAS 041]|uniref:hypothetical protein n=1 Tax=Salinimicrobium sp. GXAS 041 TaxID=3400806 RepID=UPI003C718F6B